MRKLIKNIWEYKCNQKESEKWVEKKEESDEEYPRDERAEESFREETSKKGEKGHCSTLVR